MDQQDQQGGHLGADQASDRGAQEEQSAGHDGPADGEVGEVRLQEGLLLQEETEEGSGGGKGKGGPGERQFQNVNMMMMTSTMMMLMMMTMTIRMMLLG